MRYTVKQTVYGSAGGATVVAGGVVVGAACVVDGAACVVDGAAVVTAPFWHEHAPPLAVHGHE